VGRQRIGVVGGGVSGLVCAWALAVEHDVTVIEGAPVLGGHVRTLGANVEVALPPGVRLDAGVILFERRNFPTAHRLLGRLGVAVRNVPGATGMYLDPHRCWLSPFGVRESGHRLWLPPTRALHLLPLRRQRRAFLARVRGATRAELLERPVAAYLVDDDLSTWLRLLLMYAWSTPFDRTAELPAAMAIPMLTGFLASEQWTSVVGGTWAFVSALTERLAGRVRTGSPAVRVERGAGVAVTLADGEVLRFDQVVLAAGPDRVLGLLADPTRAEIDRFGPWYADEVEAVVHRDDGPWACRALDYRSEFDLFRTARGYGYSACLNRIAGLGDGPPWYGLAFQLGDEIAAEHRIWVQLHRVPRYTVAAVRQVDAVLAHNGADRTWHVGAWLGDGLQEGAVRTALDVAAALGAPDAAALVGG
jgi:predicted NAD/FAD-binding protein